MEIFRHQNLDIKYIQTGQGQPIVFLHNGGTSHVIWKDVIAQLTGSYEIFAPDLLGYGSSSRPGSDYTLDKHVEILTAFIEYHQLRNITLVGNCMGSAMSIKYAMNHPENVSSLVLINPLTVNTFTAGKLGSFLRLRQKAPGFSRTIYKGLGHFRLNNLMSKQSLRMQFGSIGKEKHLEKTENLCACFTRDGQMDSLLRTLDDLVNYDAFDRFTPSENFPPICTIWGLENEILSADVGRRLNTTLQPEREEWIEGGGHLVMMEAPERVAEIIRDFITSK